MNDQSLPHALGRFFAAPLVQTDPDPEKPAITSGIRLGSPAATTRGFAAPEFAQVGEMIADVLDGLSGSNDGSNGAVEASVGARVLGLCGRFPIYPRR